MKSGSDKDLGAHDHSYSSSAEIEESNAGIVPLKILLISA